MRKAKETIGTLEECKSTLDVISLLEAACALKLKTFSYSLPLLVKTLKRTLKRDLNMTPLGANMRRNCDVMVTAAALRKGWERRCDYGTPCCPFEYALEPFDTKAKERS